MRELNARFRKFVIIGLCFFPFFWASDAAAKSCSRLGSLEILDHAFETQRATLPLTMLLLPSVSLSQSDALRSAQIEKIEAQFSGLVSHIADLVSIGNGSTEQRVVAWSNNRIALHKDKVEMLSDRFKEYLREYSRTLPSSATAVHTGVITELSAVFQKFLRALDRCIEQ
jgi:hypothetical protein